MPLNIYAQRSRFWINIFPSKSEGLNELPLPHLRHLSPGCNSVCCRFKPKPRLRHAFGKGLGIARVLVSFCTSQHFDDSHTLTLRDHTSCCFPVTRRWWYQNKPGSVTHSGQGFRNCRPAVILRIYIVQILVLMTFLGSPSAGKTCLSVLFLHISSVFFAS